MIWLFCILLVTIITFVIFWINEGSINWIDFGDYCFSIFIGLIIGSFLFGILTLFCFVFAPRECFLETNKPIYSLEDNPGINVNFYLGCGNINSQLQYYVATNENGIIHISTINSNIADFLYINNNETPRIEYWKHQYKNKFLRRWFYIDNCYQYRILIHKGTIKYDFNVDLK